MEKLAKICCVAGLGVTLLFSACNEDRTPARKLTKSAHVVTKPITRPITKPTPPATQTAAPGAAGKKQAPASDLTPTPDSVKDSSKGGEIDGAGGLQKAGIFTPMEKYDSKGRVDPFIPLIAEKKVSVEPGLPQDLRPKRILTPLEKLELSQVKLVAVVEMQGRTIAMVEEASGKGYEVSIGTYMGPNGGRVTSITRKGIQIEENVKDFQGKQRKRYEEIKFHKSEDGE